MTEIHDVVKLLLARMESHPEEFGGDLMEEDSREDRWWRVIRDVREYGNDAECEAVDAVMRKIKLQHAHEAMMDELCNGEERRRKEQEIREEEYKRYSAAQQSSVGASLRNTYNQMTLTAVKGYDPATDTYELDNGLRLTKEQVVANPGIVGTLKKALGL